LPDKIKALYNVVICLNFTVQFLHILSLIVAVYDRPLAEHMCSETSGDFRRLLTLIVTVSQTFKIYQLIVICSYNILSK